MKNDEDTIRDGVATVYMYGEGVVEGEDLVLRQDEIAIPGWNKTIKMDPANPYFDMTDGD